MTPEIGFIIGPDAVRDQSQMRQIAAFACEQGVDTIRGGIYKPRTVPRKNGIPEFIGLGAEVGIPIVQDSLVGTCLGFITEFIDVDDVKAVAMQLIHTPDLIVDGQIGARTGPGNTVKKITTAIRTHIPTAKQVLVKNPMEAGLKPWKSKIEWAQDGAPDLQMLGGARGNYSTRVRATRNSSNLHHAVELKQELNIPIVVDPSHMGGLSPENVILTAQKAVRYHNRILDETGMQLISAFMLEVDPDPSKAECDRDQLINLCQAVTLITWIRKNIRMADTIL